MEKNNKKIWKWLREYLFSIFYYDFSIRRLIEFSFPIAALALFVIDKYYIGIYNTKYYIIFIFISWAGLALIGFFIPSTKEMMLIMHPCNNPDINRFPGGPGGIPLEIRIRARGGFIAGRKIKIKAIVKKFDEHIDTLTEFQNSFDEFSLVWFNSFRYPVEKGKQMKTQSAGGVDIKPNKLKGNATIIFNTQGEYGFRSIYKFKDDQQMHSEQYDEKKTFIKKLHISPSENYISLRNFSITYSLTLVVLLFTIIQLKLI